MSEIQRNSEVGRAPKNTYAQNTPNENWRRWPENPIADFVMSPEESLYPTEADNQNADNARTKILNFLRNVINEGKNILNIPNGTGLVNNTIQGTDGVKALKFNYTATEEFLLVITHESGVEYGTPYKITDFSSLLSSDEMTSLKKKAKFANYLRSTVLKDPLPC